SYYYDAKGRTIQQQKDNYMSATDVITRQFSFVGLLLSRDEIHSASGTAYSNFDVLTENLYDQLGRLVAVEKKLGSNLFKSIVNYDLDDFGRLKDKRLDASYNSVGLETLAYSYNIQGQITGINKDYALKTPGL